MAIEWTIQKINWVDGGVYLICIQYILSHTFLLLCAWLAWACTNQKKSQFNLLHESKLHKKKNERQKPHHHQSNWISMMYRNSRLTHFIPNINFISQLTKIYVYVLLFCVAKWKLIRCWGYSIVRLFSLHSFFSFIPKICFVWP